MYDIKPLSDRQTELCDFGLIKRITIPSLWDQNREPVPFRVGTVQVVFFCKVPSGDPSEFSESKVHFYWQEKPRASSATTSAFHKLTSMDGKELQPDDYSVFRDELPFPKETDKSLVIKSARAVSLGGPRAIGVDVVDTEANCRSVDLIIYDNLGRRLQIYFRAHNDLFSDHRETFSEMISSIVWQDDFETKSC